ncbi:MULTISPECIES: hypothetical protein [Helicobacter]|uniref:hypothetical protein n=1 Tax=Helicobacter TaxID=209 RepID=UPI0011DE1ACC|nr:MULTISPECIES: hypothetical protein [Helicobacter]
MESAFCVLFAKILNARQVATIRLPHESLFLWFAILPHIESNFVQILKALRRIQVIMQMLEYGGLRVYL